jgi:hypothetical protein
MLSAAVEALADGWRCVTRRLLLEHGGAAQLTAVNADGKTAYTVAAERAERMYGMPEHGQAKSLADLLNPPPELAEAPPRQL